MRRRTFVEGRCFSFFSFRGFSRRFSLPSPGKEPLLPASLLFIPLPFRKEASRACNLFRSSDTSLEEMGTRGWSTSIAFSESPSLSPDPPLRWGAGSDVSFPVSLFSSLDQFSRSLRMAAAIASWISSTVLWLAGSSCEERHEAVRQGVM